MALGSIFVPIGTPREVGDREMCPLVTRNIRRLLIDVMASLYRTVTATVCCIADPGWDSVANGTSKLRVVSAEVYKINVLYTNSRCGTFARHDIPLYAARWVAGLEDGRGVLKTEGGGEED